MFFDYADTHGLDKVYIKFMSGQCVPYYVPHPEPAATYADVIELIRSARGEPASSSAPAIRHVSRRTMQAIGNADASGCYLHDNKEIWLTTNHSDIFSSRSIVAHEATHHFQILEHERLGRSPFHSVQQVIDDEIEAFTNQRDFQRLIGEENEITGWSDEWLRVVVKRQYEQFAREMTQQAQIYGLA